MVLLHGIRLQSQASCIALDTVINFAMYKTFPHKTVPPQVGFSGQLWKLSPHVRMARGG